MAINITSYKVSMNNETILNILSMMHITHCISWKLEIDRIINFKYNLFRLCRKV